MKSTIVLRPSRIAITLGILIAIMFFTYNLYTSWIEDISFPTYKEDGFLVQAYFLVNPCYAALRTLGIIYYIIQSNGEFTWADFAVAVPSKNYYDSYLREG